MEHFIESGFLHDSRHNSKGSGIGECTLTTTNNVGNTGGNHETENKK